MSSPRSLTIAKLDRWGAFTLIELLVTICVIAVLAVLLLSGYRTVIEAQKSATCLNNLKAIGIAMNEFMNDHNGYGPPSSNGTFFDDKAGLILKKEWHWMTHLAPYVGAPDYQGNMSAIFTCPADPNVKNWPKERPYLHDPSLDDRANKLTSYGYNYDAFSTSNSYVTQNPPVAPRPTRQAITNPSRLIIVADGREDGSNSIVYPNPTARPSLRHRGRFNAVFLDGHVETLDAAAATNFKKYWKALANR